MNKKSIIVCLTIIVAFVVLSIIWDAYKEYHEQRLQEKLGIRYPVVRNDPKLLQQMIKEGHSLDDGPLIYEAISNARPKVRERDYTLQEIKNWDKRASLLVKILIDNGADLNSTGGITDWPPLAFAACWHLETVVEILLKAGADPNLGLKNDNNSPLHWAFIYFWDDMKNNRILELLVHHGADVNALDENGDTPLHMAIEHEADISIIKLFLEAGADPSLRNKDGLTALDIERSYPDPNAEVVKLLEDYLRDIPVPREEEVLQKLSDFLGSGGDIEERDINEETALCRAARSGHLKVINFLLDRGANVNVSSKAGFTPLHRASQEGHVEIAALLVEHGANLYLINLRDFTPLHLALMADRNKVKTVKLLIDAGSDVDAQGSIGSPLNISTGKGDIEIVKLLIAAGAKVNLRSSAGETPLHRAAIMGHADIAELLIQNGADINAKESSGMSPLDCAIHISRSPQAQAVAELLRTHGGKEYITGEIIK